MSQILLLMGVSSGGELACRQPKQVDADFSAGDLLLSRVTVMHKVVCIGDLLLRHFYSVGHCGYATYCWC